MFNNQLIFHHNNITYLVNYLFLLTILIISYFAFGRLETFQHITSSTFCIITSGQISRYKISIINEHEYFNDSQYKLQRCFLKELYYFTMTLSCTAPSLKAPWNKNPAQSNSQGI